MANFHFRYDGLQQLHDSNPARAQPGREAYPPTSSVSVTSYYGVPASSTESTEYASSAYSANQYTRRRDSDNVDWTGIMGGSGAARTSTGLNADVTDAVRVASSGYAERSATGHLFDASGLGNLAYASTLDYSSTASSSQRQDRDFPAASSSTYRQAKQSANNNSAVGHISNSYDRVINYGAKERLPDHGNRHSPTIIQGSVSMASSTATHTASTQATDLQSLSQKRINLSLPRPSQTYPQQFTQYPAELINRGESVSIVATSNTTRVSMLEQYASPYNPTQNQPPSRQQTPRQLVHHVVQQAVQHQQAQHRQQHQNSYVPHTDKGVSSANFYTPTLPQNNNNVTKPAASRSPSIAAINASRTTSSSNVYPGRSQQATSNTNDMSLKSSVSRDPARQPTISMLENSTSITVSRPPSDERSPGQNQNPYPEVFSQTQAQPQQDKQPPPRQATKPPAQQTTHAFESVSRSPPTTVDPNQIYNSSYEYQRQIERANAEHARLLTRNAEEEAATALANAAAAEAEKEIAEKKTAQEEGSLKVLDKQLRRQNTLVSPEPNNTLRTTEKELGESRPNEKDSQSSTEGQEMTEELPSDKDPTVAAMEAEMRAMVQKMREYQSKDPKLFQNVWESVKKTQISKPVVSSPTVIPNSSKASPTTLQSPPTAVTQVAQSVASISEVITGKLLQNTPGADPDLAVTSQKRARVRPSRAKAAVADRKAVMGQKTAEREAAAVHVVEPNRSEFDKTAEIVFNKSTAETMPSSGRTVSEASKTVGDGVAGSLTADRRVPQIFTPSTTARPKTPILPPTRNGYARGAQSIPSNRDEIPALAGTQANSIVPPSSKKTTIIWQKELRPAISKLAAEVLNSIPENEGISVEPETIEAMLDMNLSYVELCDRIWNKGLKMDRTTMAKALLTAIPSGKKRPRPEPDSNDLSTSTIRRGAIQLTNLPRSPPLAGPLPPAASSSHILNPISSPIPKPATIKQQISTPLTAERPSALGGRGSRSGRKDVGAKRGPYMTKAIKERLITAAATCTILADQNVKTDQSTLPLEGGSSGLGKGLPIDTELEKGVRSLTAVSVPVPAMQSNNTTWPLPPGIGQSGQTSESSTSVGPSWKSVSTIIAPASASASTFASASSGPTMTGVQLTTFVPRLYTSLYPGSPYAFGGANPMLPDQQLKPRPPLTHAQPVAGQVGGTLSENSTPRMFTPNHKAAVARPPDYSLSHIGSRHLANVSYVPAQQLVPPPPEVVTKEMAARKRRTFEEIIKLAKLPSQKVVQSIELDSDSESDIEMVPISKARRLDLDIGLSANFSAKSDAAAISEGAPAPLLNRLHASTLQQPILTAGILQPAIEPVASEKPRRDISLNPFRDFVDIVQPIDRKVAIKKSRYNPQVIARDILISIGQHLSETSLNCHLEILKHRFTNVNDNSDLSTFRWPLVDPVGSQPITKAQSLVQNTKRRKRRTQGDMSSAGTGGSKGLMSTSARAIESSPLRLEGEDHVMDMDERKHKGTYNDEVMILDDEPRPKRVGRPPKVPQAGPYRTERDDDDDNASTRRSGRARAEINYDVKRTFKLQESLPPSIQQVGQQKKRGRPVGWRKGALNNPSYSISANSALVTNKQPQRRRPAGSKNKTLYQSSTQPGDDVRLTFRGFQCFWSGCQAILHNLQAFEAHLKGVHGKVAKGNGKCLWNDCGGDGFESSIGMQIHLDLHVQSMRQDFGEGPRANSLTPSSLSAVTLSKSSYLYDGYGRQVTPSIEGQEIHYHGDAYDVLPARSDPQALSHKIQGKVNRRIKTDENFANKVRELEKDAPVLIHGRKDFGIDHELPDGQSWLSTLKVVDRGYLSYGLIPTPDDSPEADYIRMRRREKAELAEAEAKVAAKATEDRKGKGKQA